MAYLVFYPSRIGASCSYPKKRMTRTVSTIWRGCDPCDSSFPGRRCLLIGLVLPCPGRSASRPASPGFPGFSFTCALLPALPTCLICLTFLAPRGRRAGNSEPGIVYCCRDPRHGRRGRATRWRFPRRCSGCTKHCPRPHRYYPLP